MAQEKSLLRVIFISVSFLLLLLGYCFSSLNNLLNGNILINWWISPQFYINYQEFGFIKRGFIGSLIYLIHPNPSSNSIFILSFIFMCLLFLAYWKFIFSGINKFKTPQMQTMFMAVLVASPALFMQWGYDMGRYDQVICLIFLAILTLLGRENYFISALLCGLAMLVHEVFLLMYFPIIFSIALFQLRKNKLIYLLQKISLLCLPIGVVLICILLYGQYENGIEDLIARMQNTNALLGKNQQQIYNQFLIWTRDIKDNIEYTLGRLFVSDMNARALKFELLSGFLYLSFFVYFYIQLHRLNNIDFNIISYLPFTGFVLFIIGVDYSRWFATIIMNMIVIFAYKIKYEVKRDISIIIPQGISTYFLISSIVLGPFGVVQAFPLLFSFVKLFILKFVL